MKRGKREVLVIESAGREGLKKEIKKNGLKCDCGEKVYESVKRAMEHQSNHNRYFKYLRCTQCQKLYYLWTRQPETM
jgi:hypothetical protein